MKHFNLEECVAGKPCHTNSSFPKKAEFLFMSDGLAPLVMFVSGRMENYTRSGRHIYNPELDLVMQDGIDPTRSASPTAGMYYMDHSGKVQSHWKHYEMSLKPNTNHPRFNF